MGIIRTQSIIGSFWVYLGAFLGFVTSALLFPHYLDAEQIGLLNLLVTYGTLFAQFCSAGFTNTITRMFPYFRDENKKHNGFLFLTVLVVAIATILAIALFSFLYPYIISNNSDSGGNLLQEYAILIIPMFIFTAFFNIFDCYTKALLNATRGIVMKEVVVRILTMILILLYILNCFDFQSFVYWYVCIYGVVFLYMIFALMKDRQFFLHPNFSLIDKPMAKELFRVSMFGIIITSANIIVINIDRVMIEKLMIENPLAQVGIYTTCSYFATMVILPNRPLQKITSTLVAEAWKRNDMSQLQVLYKKSTITQLIVGTLVFFGLCINLDYIFQLIPEEYSAGRWVIIFIGIMNLSDMAAGINKDIVSNSPQYEKLSHWTFALIIGIIALNFIFIPNYGISGAAISSCIARIIYNIVAFSYVHRKWKLQPYSWQHLLIIAIGLVVYGICFIIPETSNFICNIAIKSTALTVLFCTTIYFVHVSEDVNDLADSFLRKIGIKKS
ncbi:MAG: oligosaccharide flippase family protein [Bacteroidales bacterium]|nr:oligosaccharide flippase family protein [Bacteroidales bacterium]